MKRALVTGSTGFIGAALCRGLLEVGFEVRAFHRASSNQLLLKDLPVEHAVGDLTLADTLAQAVHDVDVVFHVAALLGGSRRSAGRHYAITVEGTRAVLRAAKEAGVKRLVYTSSVAALGVPPLPATGGSAPLLMSERHTWNYRADRWMYGYAKYLAELEVQAAVAQGLDAVIVNPSVVLGAGDIYRQSRSLVVQVAQRRLPAVVEGGLNVVHLADVVAGHIAALQHGRRGERYILANQNLTIVNLVERIAATAGVPAPGLVLPASLVRALAVPYAWLERWLPLPVSASELYLAGRYFYFDNQKSISELDLRYTRSADQAIRDAYEWFAQMGDLPG